MQEFYIKSADAYLRYQDLPGNETPILFIHGLGCAGSFDYVQVAAQEEISAHRCILVDLLGAGYSDKPEKFDYRISSHVDYLKEWIESLKLEEFILFGHSLGGPVAIELAAYFAESTPLLKALILSESNLEASTEGAGSYQIGKLSEDFFVKQGFQDLVQSCRLSGNQMWAATLAQCAPYAVHRLSVNAVEGRSPSWRELLYQLSLPHSFIFGENSLPDMDYERLKQQGIHMEIVKNAGHSMAWENPKGLAAAICRSMFML